MRKLICLGKPSQQMPNKLHFLGILKSIGPVYWGFKVKCMLLLLSGNITATDTSSMSNFSVPRPQIVAWALQNGITTWCQ